MDYAGAALTGFPAGLPQAGQYVSVRSLQAVQGARLAASAVALQSDASRFEPGVRLELEGVITHFTSASDFAVNGVEIISNAETRFEYGSASHLALNALVEVDGKIDANGAMVADEISIKESVSSGIDELSGNIAMINPVEQTFTLAGNAVTVDSSTIWEDESAQGVRQMNFAYLQPGDFVEINVKPLGNGKLLALRIRREDGEGAD
ncbi:MAG: hypothetical protein HZT40_00730 [Candidatus Thiothrix singaporensis]|uniref:DUF5666 domain-containing protein n=1 Tax=Candidatus Thiothrix singaporensis TaxID=2799669 RepID=A0A7L6AMU1_9GAMM|nr:MAG: hypothetical protein HZT40_00730 [Candidatus Thiothrix singaporensis]